MIMLTRLIYQETREFQPFQCADLSSYLEDDCLLNLRANSFQQGENDGGSYTLPTLGPRDSQGSPTSYA